MPALSLFNRDIPAFETVRPALFGGSRLTFIVFPATHCLRSATSVAGLTLAIGDTHSITGFAVVASRFTEPK